MNISAMIAARSRTCGRWRNATRRKTVRNARAYRARHPDGAEFLLHLFRKTQGTRHQRALRQRAEECWRIQGLASARLRLLLRQAFAPGKANQKWREKLSDRAAVDDQSLITASRVRRSRGQFSPVALDDNIWAVIERPCCHVLHQRD